MPMIPSPLAGIAYAAVKIIGYTGFSSGLNKVLGRAVSPYKFGAAKTALGLAGGIAYLIFLANIPGLAHASDLVVFSGAIPVRAFVWFVALAMFYGFRNRPLQMCVVVFFGVAWSYVLDCVMWLIYKILPGMVTPFC